MNITERIAWHVEQARASRRQPEPRIPRPRTEGDAVGQLRAIALIGRFARAARRSR